MTNTTHKMDLEEKIKLAFAGQIYLENDGSFRYKTWKLPSGFLKKWYMYFEGLAVKHLLKKSRYQYKTKGMLFWRREYDDNSLYIAFMGTRTRTSLSETMKLYNEFERVAVGESMS